jgi:predicted nucleic-acid-binding protein
MKRIVVDTNILVRLLVEDDADQSRTAAQFLEMHRIILIDTVLLETEWVLRSRFKLDRATIVQLFEAMTALDMVEVKDDGRVRYALGAYARGMDFADALHVSVVAGSEMFFTFDRALVQHARQEYSQIPVELAH